MLRVVRLPKLLVLTLGMLALFANSAQAQQIQWRLDYNKARQEAKDRNLPLFMDVGTSTCYYCNQLDATTFRDPAVVKMVNEHFVPVRVDGNKYRTLIEMLNIKGYPTLVFATPQGKVIDLRSGYEKAPEFYGWTQHVLTMLYPPAGNAGGLQLTSAQKAAPPATDRAKQARTLFAVAEEEFRTQQYVCCLMRCKIIVASFADLPEAKSARELAATLKNDPERLRVTSEQLSQALCDLYLDMAGTLIQKGQREQAVPYLQWIAQACPNTPQAQAAQQVLQQLPPPAAPTSVNLGKVSP